MSTSTTYFCPNCNQSFIEIEESWPHECPNCGYRKVGEFTVEDPDKPKCETCTSNTSTLCPFLNDGRTPKVNCKEN